MDWYRLFFDIAISRGPGAFLQVSRATKRRFSCAMRLRDTRSGERSIRHKHDGVSWSKI